MNGTIDVTGVQRRFELCGKESLAADLRQGDIDDPVTLCRVNLIRSCNGCIRSRQLRHHVSRLPKRKR